MKVLVIGAKGMLGHALMHTFQDDKPVGWDLGDLDITDAQATNNHIARLKPDLILNAAAYTNVDKAEEQKELAFQVNAQGVANLAQAALANSSMLVHYSTDYVFGNERKEGYTEEDTPEHALNIYGESKREGELALIAAMKQGLQGYLIRSSWLFGPNGKNFVETILRLYESNPKLTIVNDQWGKPTYTLDLAAGTKKLIENDYQFGIYHLMNEPETTWYEFTRMIVNIKYNNQTQKEILPISSDAFPRLANRPHYSILLNTKGPKMRPWQEALQEYIGLVQTRTGDLFDVNEAL